MTELELRVVRALVASAIFAIAGLAFDLLYSVIFFGYVTTSVIITTFVLWWCVFRTPEDVTVRQGALVGAVVGVCSHFTHGILHAIWAILIQLQVFVEVNTEAGSDGVALTTLLNVGGALNQGLFYTIIGLLFAGVLSIPVGVVFGAGSALLQDRRL